MRDRRKAWWREPTTTIADAVVQTFRAIEKDRKQVSKENVFHARLYGSRDIAGLGFTAGAGTYTERMAASTDNIVQSVCDTAAALIAKDRPRARFMTDGAEHSDYARAELLEKLVFGVFQEVDVWDKAVDTFRDATIFGKGCVKVFAHEGRVCVERVLIDEIFVDERECMGGVLPRQLHHRKWVSREVLKAMFPDFEEDLENAQDTAPNPGGRQSNPDLVEVIESIHRPDRRVDVDDEEEAQAEDGTTPHGGRRTIVVPGIDEPLLDEPWVDSEFNYLFYSWTRLPSGFYDQGLAAELAPIQLQINKLYRFIGRAHDLYAIPRIFLNRLSRINPDHVTNEIGAMVEYTGTPPTFMTPTAIGPEVYNWLDQLVARGYRRAGIGESTAAAVKAPGIESGVGQREVRDTAAGRFIIPAQRYEDLIRNVARWVVKTAKSIYDDDGEFTSIFAGKTVAQKIDWAEVDELDERYIVKVEMSSILGMTPAGRLQAVMDLYHEGFVDRDEARHLLNHPDLEQSDDIADADRQNLDRACEALLRGEWVSPWPLQDLVRGVKLIGARALLADAQGAPPEILELCIRWIEQAKQLAEGPAPDPTVLAAQQQAAQQQAAPAAPPMPGMEQPGMVAPPPPAMLAPGTPQLQ